MEEKLSRIKIKSISEDEKNSLWHKILVKNIKKEENSKNLSVFNIFNFSMKKYIVGFIALALIIGGGGVVAASNSSIPGDFLFPVDLAIEKIQIRLVSEDKKEDLKFKFATERIAEVRNLAEKRGAFALVTDLSTASSLEIEAEIFTNETLVKIEANDRKYGFITEAKAEDAIIKEITEKYSLTEASVRAVIVFSKEDRISRPDDREFLNKTKPLKFSSDEDEDVGLALTSVNKFLGEISDSQKTEQIQKILNELLVLLGDDSNVRIERKNDEIKIKSDSSEVEIKFEDKKDKSGSSKEFDEKDDKKQESNGNDDDSSSSDINTTTDVREDDNEVFCRGEWRDQEDCDDSKNDDSDDDSKDNDDDDKSDSGKDDKSDDEDNSGSGGGDDN